jgi:hypothetical protein
MLRPGRWPPQFRLQLHSNIATRPPLGPVLRPPSGRDLVGQKAVGVAPVGRELPGQERAVCLRRAPLWPHRESRAAGHEGQFAEIKENIYMTKGKDSRWKD